MDRWSEAGAIAGSKEPRSRRAAVYQDRPAPPPPDGRAFLCPDPAFPAARAPRGPFHQQQVRSLRRHARPAALAVFAVLALALPPAAQSVTTLVSNAGQSTTSAPTGDADRAQAFTTGAAGATLSSVEIISGDTEGDDMAVSLCTVDSSGYPTSSCTALTAPSSFASGTLVFTDPASTTLAATTTYTLLITSPGGESLRLTNTSSNAEETGAAAGWTIANTYHIKNSANVWGPGGFTTSFLITIKGTLSTTNTAPTGAPTITGTAQVGQTLTAVTTGILDADGLTSPTYTYQWIRVNGTEADIAGENSSTYTLVDADLGKTLKVRVTFDDDGDPRGRCPWFADKLVRNGRGRAGRAGMGASRQSCRIVPLRIPLFGGGNDFAGRDVATSPAQPRFSKYGVLPGGKGSDERHDPYPPGSCGKHSRRRRAGDRDRDTTITAVLHHRLVGRPAPALAGPTDSRDTPNFSRWTCAGRVWGWRVSGWRDRGWNPDT